MSPPRHPPDGVPERRTARFAVFLLRARKTSAESECGEWHRQAGVVAPLAQRCLCRRLRQFIAIEIAARVQLAVVDRLIRFSRRSHLPLCSTSLLQPPPTAYDVPETVAIAPSIGEHTPGLAPCRA